MANKRASDCDTDACKIPSASGSDHNRKEAMYRSISGYAGLAVAVTCGLGFLWECVANSQASGAPAVATALLFGGVASMLWFLREIAS